ncbi:hypothetical protein EG68_01870 [Paragonimus skrjabini miyazakii]|uniref:FAR1 domain-containing protein n=1 Tax=Paragonimus skrjabini miyazakii TaxID=59628 RepID=A0A8S9Z5T9_9TREM|nr:hypothetical protein EG68_01870 [Paragonimus skrjabini miyazakii]
MSIRVDVSDDFRKHFPEDFACSAFQDLQQKLKVFQRETGTCYVTRNVCTRAQWYKASGKVIPEAAKYKHFYLSCIHCAKRSYANDGRNRRFQDYQCPSVIHVTYKDGALRISHSFMVHNHRTMDVDPSVYPVNRRLDKREEELLYQVMDSLPRTRDVIEFANHEFDVILNAGDVKKIRQRKKARIEIDGDMENPATVLPESDEDGSLKSKCLLMERTDSKAEAHLVTSRLCEALCRLETNQCKNAVQELKKIISFLSVGVNFIVEPANTCYAAVPTPSSSMTEPCQLSVSNNWDAFA